MRGILNPTKFVIEPNKIESSRSSWYDYLIRIARIFYRFDGQPYDRDALLATFSDLNSRSATPGGRDASNFRDEFGAYGTYLGIFHLEQHEGEWKVFMSEAAKRFLCCENPNAGAFCRSQLALFQYPNGAGAVLGMHGTMTVQANSKTDTMRELEHSINLNPFRLLCEIVVAEVEIKGRTINDVAVPFHTFFCMVNDERINTAFNHDLHLVSAVFDEYNVPVSQIPMNLDGLTNFKRNFHIFDRTSLFIRDSSFGMMVSQVNPQVAYDCIKVIAGITQHYSAFESQYGSPDDDAVKDILCQPLWGRYYDASILGDDILQQLGAVVDLPPAAYSPQTDEDGSDSDTSDNTENVEVVDRIPGGENVLLYGVPGAGKSWTIQNEYCLGIPEDQIERLVFHPDYTYSDFVGQILPVSENDGIRYRFTEGPFTRILMRAEKAPQKQFYLIIEEINRGNAPAIFGDIFQLLDRAESAIDGVGPKGTSQYGITNADVADKVYEDPNHFVRIPSNMSILATMNTADQNVFTLDTAFQRRWHMRMVENSFDNHPFADNPILDTGISWKNFCLAINQEILLKSAGMTSSEDKRLGAYFVSADDLIRDPQEDNENADPRSRMAARRHNSLFAEKVIKYLWDDAFKYYRGDIFEISNYSSLEAIIKQFMQKNGAERLLIFKEEIRNRISNPVQ